MVFPDGTHALGETTFDVRAGRVRHRRRPVRLRQVDAAAHRLRPRPRPPAARSTSTAASLGYVFQDATLLQWRTVQRNVELLAELEGSRQGRAARRGRREHRPRRPRRLREEVPEAAVGRHEDARLAGPLAGAGPEGVPVRRAVRRARRDHPRAAQRRADRAVPAQGLRRRCSSPTRSPRRCSCRRGCW